MQWLYEAFYSAIGELFADINDLGVEIFDLSWVQAVVSLFTMLGWSLFVVGVVVAVFEVAIESQSGRVNIKGTALNVLKGFFGASLVGALPVQLYKTCCTLQGMFTADLAGIYAGSQSSTIGAFAGQVLRLAFVPSEAVEVGLKIIFFQLAFAYCVIKIFFANIKRGGILLVQIAVGSLYLFSVPRGYTDGFYQWNKNMIARILADYRYCGDKEYPEVVDEVTFQKAAEKRKRKSASQQKTEAQAALRKKCAGRITSYIESEVLCLLNSLAMNPERIITPQIHRAHSQRLDVLKSELEGLIGQLPVDENRAREVLQEIATEMYADIDPREYETQRLRRLFQKEAPRSELDANLIAMSISAVLMDGNGNVKIRLKNDQIVERSEQDG